jgi:type IV secretion system protein VirB3
MTDRNPGLLADPLFVGLTRPPMRFGVTFSALLVNALLTMELFVLTKQLLTLLVALPVHGVCMLACARDARFFDLAMLWMRARVGSLFSTFRFFRAASLGPLRPMLALTPTRRLQHLEVRP